MTSNSRVSRIQQNARNQEPGQDEEEYHAGPAKDRYELDDMLEEISTVQCLPEVIYQDHKNSQAAKSVQGRHPAAGMAVAAGFPGIPCGRFRNHACDVHETARPTASSWGRTGNRGLKRPLSARKGRSTRA